MTYAEHLKLHDKQIAAIQALVKKGMQMMVEWRTDAWTARKEMRELRAAQKRTEVNLDRLLTSLGRNTNGKHERDIR